MASYPGVPHDDPVAESRHIRRDELSPIVAKLQAALKDLEEYVGEVDYDDDGRRGD